MALHVIPGKTLVIVFWIKASAKMNVLRDNCDGEMYLQTHSCL